MSLLEHIELADAEQVCDAILDTYHTQWYLVVSFMYFANLMKWKLLESTPEPRQKDYKKALLTSDFLLADGIALQLFYRRSALWRANKITPPNLNGTDFIPYFFETTLRKHPQAHVSLMMFWDEKIGKWEEYAQLADQAFIDRYGRPFNYSWQTNYSNKSRFEFDRQAYERTLSDDDGIRILFVCLGTPTQEIRTEANKAMIEKYWCVVLNAWWTIDYMTWLEQRAPKRVVQARVLETIRRITLHPKKNLKKFLAMFGIIRYRKYCITQKFFSY
jgi:UDP-N-acetyl-D-mannosaminuronic acid transferase (WecB/TagA/CpsF family)